MRYGEGRRSGMSGWGWVRLVYEVDDRESVSGASRGFVTAISIRGALIFGGFGEVEVDRFRRVKSGKRVIVIVGIK